MNEQAAAAWSTAAAAGAHTWPSASVSAVGSATPSSNGSRAPAIDSELRVVSGIVEWLSQSDFSAPTTDTMDLFRKSIQRASDASSRLEEFAAADISFRDRISRALDGCTAVQRVASAVYSNPTTSGEMIRILQTELRQLGRDAIRAAANAQSAAIASEHSGALLRRLAEKSRQIVARLKTHEDDEVISVPALRDLQTAAVCLIRQLYSPADAHPAAQAARTSELQAERAEKIFAPHCLTSEQRQDTSASTSSLDLFIAVMHQLRPCSDMDGAAEAEQRLRQALAVPLSDSAVSGFIVQRALALEEQALDPDPSSAARRNLRAALRGEGGAAVALLLLPNSLRVIAACSSHFCERYANECCDRLGALLASNDTLLSRLQDAAGHGVLAAASLAELTSVCLLARLHGILHVASEHCYGSDSEKLQCTAPITHAAPVADSLGSVLAFHSLRIRKVTRIDLAAAGRRPSGPASIHCYCKLRECQAHVRICKDGGCRVGLSIIQQRLQSNPQLLAMCKQLGLTD
jgi:hypothetical protein